MARRSAAQLFLRGNDPAKKYCQRLVLRLQCSDPAVTPEEDAERMLLEQPTSVSIGHCRCRTHYLFALTAAYAFGLARNHPFVDGNKRVALLAVRAYLFVNGFRFEPEQVETVTTFERLAAGEIDQQQLAAWIRQNAFSRS